MSVAFSRRKKKGEECKKLNLKKKSQQPKEVKLTRLTYLEKTLKSRTVRKMSQRRHIELNVSSTTFLRVHIVKHIIII